MGLPRQPLVAALGVAIALAGCQRSNVPPRAQAATAPPAALAKGYVDVEGGLIRLAAPRDGVISAVLVHEGDRVAAGQALATLDDRQARLAADLTRAEEDERRAQVAVAQTRVDNARREADRLDRLARADAAPRQEAEQASSAARAAAGEQLQAVSALASAGARRRLDALEIEARRIRSPVSGRLVRVAAAPGAVATGAGAPLFVIAPEGARIIRADLDEAFARQVRVGMTATVSPEFDDRGSHRATVVRMSEVFETPTVADDPATRVDARVLTVILRLDDDPGGLKLGERVLVSFHK